MSVAEPPPERPSPTDGPSPPTDGSSLPTDASVPPPQPPLTAAPPAASAPWGTAQPAAPAPWGTAPPAYGPQYPPAAWQTFGGYCGPVYPPRETPPAPSADTSKYAIASFVLGVFPCGIPLSVIFGWVALVKIKRTGEIGKGLAIAGLALSGVWLSVFAFKGVVATIADSGVNNMTTSTRSVSPLDLTVGDCFNSPAVAARNATGQQAEVGTVKPTPCTQPHDAEVFAWISVDDGGVTYPGSATLGARAAKACPDELGDYVLDPLSLPADIEIGYLWPLERQWRETERRAVVCFAADPTQRLSRSLRVDGTNLDSNQLRYLQAVKPYNDLLDKMAADDPKPALTDLHTMATGMIEVINTEVSILETWRWPATAQPAIDRFVADRKVTVALWRQAAAASEADFHRLVNQAAGHDDQIALDVRTALGLPTVQGQPPRHG